MKLTQYVHIATPSGVMFKARGTGRTGPTDKGH